MSPASTRSGRRVFAAAGAAVLLLASSGIASADQVEGDIVETDPLSKSISLPAGGPVALELDLYLQRQGQSTPSVTWGVPTKSASPSSSGACSGLTIGAADPSVLTMPSGWERASNGTLSKSMGASSAVSITGTAGAGGTSCTITYQGTGENIPSGQRTAVFTLSFVSSPVTAPTVNYTLTPAMPDGLNGWYTSDVTLTWNITGTPTPTVTTGCVDQSITADQAPTTYECAVSNSAGSDSESVTIKRDAAAPTVAYTSADAGSGNGPNVAGWYKAAVTATFTATDATPGSGFAGGETETGTASSGASEGSSVSVGSPTFTDLAGNTVAAGATSQTFKIDLSDPYDVSFVGGPASGESYVWGSVPAAPWCTAVDDISGPDTCDVTGYGTSVGSHTMTATANDKAGRSATATRSYTVLAWDLVGFGNPVSTTANDAAAENYIWNVMKGGRTAPLKFEIFAGPTELIDVAAVDSFKAYRTACPGGGAVTGELDFISDGETTSGNTQLRYDSAEGQFIQNWKTPKVSEDTCYRVELKTDDGSFLRAFFKLTK